MLTNRGSVDHMLRVFIVDKCDVIVNRETGRCGLEGSPISSTSWK